MAPGHCRRQLRDSFEIWRNSRAVVHDRYEFVVHAVYGSELEHADDDNRTVKISDRRFLLARK